MVNYCPQKGDIVFLNFDPQSGREQAGKRPALVISNAAYNQKVGLAIFCPITSNIKNYPFEVLLPSSLKTSGVILADHIKNLDWQARKATFVEKVSADVMTEVFDKIIVLIK